MMDIKYKGILFTFLLVLFSCSTRREATQPGDPAEHGYAYALVLHGGAGSMNIENLPPPRQRVYAEALDSALQIGLDMLDMGRSSTDAVEAVIRYMEDNPLFNAGRGAVFTHDGRNELDASIMIGNGLNAGAVAAVTNIRHPITAARAVMEQSAHVMLTGEGASEFAVEKGLEMVDPSFFRTQESYESLQRLLEEEEHGTVGCVALDKKGDLCAGTSTGGMTNKRYGRIGDSPVIGAGTYASNSTCGISCTGHGEYFIRLSVAHDISALMEYKEMSVRDAAEEVIYNKLTRAGGTGGVVCLDHFGNVAMVTNTSGMFRAYGNSEGERFTRIFKEDQ